MRHGCHRGWLTLLAILLASALASAADLTGTVTNGTTNKPAAGDEVVLLALSEGNMNEVARTTTDRAGRFTLVVKDAPGQYLVRVVHQGVTYHRMVAAGAETIEVKVFDVAASLDRVTAIMDVQRLEATGDTLEIKELVTMRNASIPPRTLMNDFAFELELPAEAQIELGMAQSPGAPPVEHTPSPGTRKGQFFMRFPLRPGDTRLLIAYKLPYTGEATLKPNLRNPLEHFTVMLPTSMRFEPEDPSIFQPRPGVTQDNVQATAQLKAGQRLVYRISGTGRLLELQKAEQAAGGETARPGGGLGLPIGSPDPLHGARWLVLAGLTALLTAGGGYVARKPARIHRKLNGLSPKYRPGPSNRATETPRARVKAVGRR